jgi:hypothetical protein
MPVELSVTVHLPWAVPIDMGLRSNRGRFRGQERARTDKCGQGRIRADKGDPGFRHFLCRYE